MHCVLRHALELSVDSQAQAREIHAELSATLGVRLAEVLDPVFSAACPESETLRIDRLELDLGVLPRDALTDTLVQRASERLAAIFASPGAAGPHERRTEESIRRLSALQVALERIETYLARGALTAHDRRTGKAELGAELVLVLEEAPQALARSLRALPHAAAARRLAQQFAPDITLRAAALLAGVAVADVEALITEWLTMIARPGAGKHASGGDASGEARRRRVIGELLELLLGATSLASALRMLAQRLVADRAASAGSTERAVVWTWVEELMSVLPPGSPIRTAIEQEARGRGLGRISRPEGGETHASQAAGEGPAQSAAMLTRRLANFSEAPETGVSARAATTSPPDGEPAPSELSANRRDTAALSAERGDARSRELRDLPERMSLREQESRREKARRVVAEQEVFHVANAGLAILWSFLPGFFQALGLVADGRFASDSARARAVLLTAHLCDGANEWAEYELLLGKILCGYPTFDPIETRIELSDRERNESRALLEAVIGHWSVLKSTSIEALRTAFLRREGTLIAQDGSWKLEVARAAHDVLLDRLPWGFGLVLLPWMLQPLYVVW